MAIIGGGIVTTTTTMGTTSPTTATISRGTTGMDTGRASASISVDTAITGITAIMGTVIAVGKQTLRAGAVASPFKRFLLQLCSYRTRGVRTLVRAGVSA